MAKSGSEAPSPRRKFAAGTAPGQLACRFFREHGKNRSLPAEKERLRKLGVQGGYPPWRGPGAGPGWRDWEGRLASLPWLSGDSFSIERVTLGVRGAERPCKRGVWGNPPHKRQAGRRPARQRGGKAAHRPVSQRLPVPTRPRQPRGKCGERPRRSPGRRGGRSASTETGRRPAGPLGSGGEAAHTPVSQRLPIRGSGQKLEGLQGPIPSGPGSCGR